MRAVAENSDPSAKEQRARRRGRGRPFTKGQSGNPGGRPKGIVARVKELIGEDGQDMLSILDGIARGTTTITVMDAEGKPVEIGPSFKDRRECAAALLDRGFGRPTTKIEGGDGGPVVVKVLTYGQVEDKPIVG